MFWNNQSTFLFVLESGKGYVCRFDVRLRHKHSFDNARLDINDNRNDWDLRIKFTRAGDDSKLGLISIEI